MALTYEDVVLGGGVIHAAEASWSTLGALPLWMESTVASDAFSIHAPFELAPILRYARSDSGHIQRQMSWLIASGHPAAKSAQQSPER